MTALFALVRADLALFFSNRRSVLMSIAAPILIAAFFGALFGTGGNKPMRIPVAVTDLDRSPMTRAIVASLQADEAFTLSELPANEARAWLNAGKVRAAIELPAGFGATAPGAMFGAAAKPVVRLAYDPSQETVLPIVRGLLAQHVSQQVSSAAFGGGSKGASALRDRTLAGPDLAPDMRQELSAMFDSIERVQKRQVAAAGAASAASGAASAPIAAAGPSLPFVTDEVAAAPRPEVRYSSYAHAFAGMGVQFVLLMGVDLGIGLLAMRRLGLWKRLRAAPLSKAVLLGSRVASCAVIAVVVQVVVFAVAIAAFGVRIEGSWIGFAGVLIAFALTTAGFGLLIAAIGRTPEVTRGLAIVVTLLMVMLGGAWVPSFLFPPWLQQASLAMPTRWAVDGFDAMTWRGLGADAAVAPVLVLLGFAVLFTALAMWRFDWEE
ncbi:MAG: ABC-2 transporter permease [Ideonella sp.]|nr:ABC-2 transporter permease [Ideonella sp.]